MLDKEAFKAGVYRKAEVLAAQKKAAEKRWLRYGAFAAVFCIVCGVALFRSLKEDIVKDGAILFASPEMECPEAPAAANGLAESAAESPAEEDRAFAKTEGSAVSEQSKSKAVGDAQTPFLYSGAFVSDPTNLVIYDVLTFGNTFVSEPKLIKTETEADGDTLTVILYTDIAPNEYGELYREFSVSVEHDLLKDCAVNTVWRTE